MLRLGREAAAEEDRVTGLDASQYQRGRVGGPGELSAPQGGHLDKEHEDQTRFQIVGHTRNINWNR